ncbi:hypothetical protein TNCV_492011 [Trichonephila clavipes]|nr:hypothetical protein TNCV_492011 [Trichonephila clavipes]
MDVCVVLLQHEGTLKSCRAASPPVRLVEREERWEAHDHLERFLFQNWGRTEPNHIVIYMMLKATDNDRRTTSLQLDLTPSISYYQLFLLKKGDYIYNFNWKATFVV